MKELLFHCFQTDEQHLTLERTGGEEISPALLIPYPDSLPLFEALGCLGCERLQWEADNRLSEPMSIEHALYHNEMQHPGVSQRIKDGFTVYCPLLYKRNVPPKFRKESTPCQTKEQISINLPDKGVGKVFK